MLLDKYISLNGLSALPMLYVSALVGIISPEMVKVLPTYNLLFNDASPETSSSPFNYKSSLTITV